MCFDELASNGQAKAQAAGRCSWTAIEFFKDFVFFAGREPRTVIGHEKDNHVVVTRCANFDRFASGSVSHGIGKQRDQRLLNQMRVD